ncbi:MAG TPA: insulinase family protein [Anaerolineae bacterium]|nr:insulinase family protein [Anaerolineae bacterium]HCC78849.1 insulinase family protein [Anaerolineae bacterium]HCM97151.1 insulinase family protein [Anaerolineae bacterium]
MAGAIIKTKLNNGLSVLLKEIHTAPLISSWIWYRVGSKDEPTGLTGISHWVEHMQFKGTPTYPSVILDKSISREGGMWNAFTYLDWTTFLETLPADKIDLALSLEADRMVNSLYEPGEVASERTVIISEREGSENEPLFKLNEAIQSTAFTVHPYHHEVIGDMADLHSITRDNLYEHYHSYYTPNNAVLALAGDFNSKAMLERIRTLYESIPAGEAPARLNRPEPPVRGEHRLSIEGPGETTYLQIAYRFPAAADPDLFPFMVLDSLLSGPSNPSAFSGGGISNKTSRLYRALVDKDLAVGVSGSGQVTIDPFLYATTITVHPKSNPDDSLLAFDAEIKRLQDEFIPESDILRAIKQARAIFAYGTENITYQAAWLGFSEMFADYKWFESYLEKLAEVTPGDIQRVAQTWLLPQKRLVGTYLPDGKVSE